MQDQSSFQIAQCPIRQKQIRESVDKYEYIWIFSVENMRNNFFKDIRNEWKTSRFFFGKNKVMAKAFGNTPETEYKEGLKQLSLVRSYIYLKLVSRLQSDISY